MSSTTESVKQLFGNFHGHLQADASNVYDVLDRGPPTDTDEGVSLVGCYAHSPERNVIQGFDFSPTEADHGDAR